MTVPRCALMLQTSEVAKVVACEATAGDVPYGAEFLNCAGLAEETTVNDTPPPQVKRADQGLTRGLADPMTRKAEPLRAVGVPAGDTRTRAKVLMAQVKILQRLQEFLSIFFSSGARQRVTIVHTATVVGTFQGKVRRDRGTDVIRFTPVLAA